MKVLELPRSSLDLSVKTEKSFLDIVWDQSKHFVQNDRVIKLAEKPGSYKTSQLVLQKFCLLAPAILYKIKNANADDAYRSVKLKMSGTYEGKSWITINQSTSTSAKVYFNSSVSTDIRYTRLTSKQLESIFVGVRQFIQEEGVLPYISLMRQFVNAQKIILPPSILFSELVSFMIQNRDNFKASQYQDRQTKKKMSFSVKKQDQIYYISDFFGFKFPYLPQVLSDGITAKEIAADLDSQPDIYERTYKNIEQVQKQIMMYNKQLKNLNNQNDKEEEVQNKYLNKQNEQNIANMKEESVQNISESVIQHKQKVDGEIKKIQAYTDQALSILIKTKLPKVLEDFQYVLAQKQIETVRQFFITQLKGLTKPFDDIPLQQLNKLPKDIHTNIIFLQNRRKIKHAQIRNQLVKYIAQLRKMGYAKMEVNTIEQYFKSRQQSIVDKIYNFITSPTQTITILKHKGERLDLQAKIRERIAQQQQQNANQLKNINLKMQSKFDDLFGDFSVMGSTINAVFGQTQQQLLQLRQSYQQQKMALIGLTPVIQNAFKMMLQQLQTKFMTNTNKKINQLYGFLQSMEQKYHQDFGFVVKLLNQQKQQLSQILNSLTKIATEITKLNSEVAIIKQMSRQSLKKQDIMMQRLSQFIKQVTSSGLNEIMDWQDKQLNRRQQIIELRSRGIKQKMQQIENQQKLLETVKNQSISTILQRKNQIQTQIQQNLNFNIPDRQAIQQKIDASLGGFVPDHKSLQKIIDQNYGKNITFPTKTLQDKINVSLNPNSFDFPTTLMQTSITNALNPDKYTFPTSLMQKSITDSLDPKQYNFSKAQLQNEIKRMTDEMVKQIKQQKQQLKTNSGQLTAVINAMAKYISNPQSKQFYSKLPSILDVLLKNTKQLMAYQDKNKGMAVKSLHERIDEIGKKFEKFLEVYKGNGDGDKRDDDKKLNQQTQKFRVLRQKYDLVKKAFLVLSQNVKIIFQKESKFTNDFIYDLVKRKVIKLGSAQLQNVMTQLQNNYQTKMDHLLSVILEGYPTASDQDENEQFVKEIIHRYNKPKRTIDFEWWKVSDKVIKL